MLYYRTVVGGEPRCQDAAVAQSVVRRIGSAEVTGPIPVSSIFVGIFMKKPLKCFNKFQGFLTVFF